MLVELVAQTEFVWQHPTLVTNGEEWQALWFEMEILNALPWPSGRRKDPLKIGRTGGVKDTSRMRARWFRS